MNLGINKEEAKVLQDILYKHIKSSAYPDLLLDTYKVLGVDIPHILAQLDIIKEIGDEPITEEERKVFLK